jgi:hypothetical protein
MKRLLVLLVLTVVATAVAAAPAYADLVAQGAGYAASPQASLAPAALPANVSYAAAHIPQAGSIGWTAAQTAGTQVTKIFGRGMSVSLPSAGQGAPGVAIAALLVLAVGGAVVALVADRRRTPAAASAAEPVRIGGHKATGQERKAA